MCGGEDDDAAEAEVRLDGGGDFIDGVIPNLDLSVVEETQEADCSAAAAALEVLDDSVAAPDSKEVVSEEGSDSVTDVPSTVTDAANETEAPLKNDDAVTVAPPTTSS